MRVLVIGVRGQVAQSLVARSAAQGVSVTTLGRPELDLTDARAIAPALARHPADVIVNAAAYTAVDQAETEPDLAYAINAAAPAEIAQAAERIGVPVIHISTDYVFDGSGEGALREDSSVAPLGVYGQSKLAGEEAVRAHCRRHVILRTAWVFSPFGRNFVKTMLDLARTRDEVRVVADQTGSPTYALDLADGILQVCRNLQGVTADGPEFGTFHITGSGFATWAEVAAAVFESSALSGGPTARVQPIGSRDYPTLAKRPANSRLSNDRIREIHGVALPPWREAVARCVSQLV